MERQFCVESIQLEKVAVLSIRGTRPRVLVLSSRIFPMHTVRNRMQKVEHHPMIVHPVGPQRFRHIGIVHDEHQRHRLCRDVVELERGRNVVPLARVFSGNIFPFGKS